MADHNDAQLLVQLAQWGTQLGLEDSYRKVFADDFDPEQADAREPELSRMLEYFETLGTLTKNGLLDTALVHDWVWVAGAWERLGPIAMREREKLGVKELYANFEALASSER